MKLSGRTALVTGGTSGIGRGLAIRLHEAGSTVIVAGRRADQLDALVRDHPGMDSVVLDMTDPASIRRAFEVVTRTHPELDVLVTMAGIMLPEDLRDPASLAVAEETITTNLLGPRRMLAEFLPFLLEQPEAVVMTVSSGLAFVPLPLTPTYSATKAAIHSLTESLRVQLAGTSVGVLELVPPAVRTPLMGQEDRESAMPLDDYLTEVMALLETQDTGEVLVERVQHLRFAERTGTYDGVLAMLAAGPPA
ncbi:SDR family NAD(P)-dependent oxidoreductase [Actinotalea ferrariae]|uniref:SDR family oxidoreductase n=1 Tax=Actinotalea ferrariae TaxID=1386098 RepID=UPI001C8BE022|nr:SDR family NAD(P)-dependent oxidoreductase [Actinotalea ferrariae]MBX9245275.1 SDR family NAD(P)-dependent oxidoreductase [Actinotalea ferrariae]